MRKKAIVLFTTLLLILSLLSIVMLFLNSTKKTHDSITKEFALLQTNSVMVNLVEYLKTIDFDEEMIFHGAKVPFNLEFEDTHVTLKIDSLHKYININHFITSISKKDNLYYNKFIDFLYEKNLNRPEYFIDLLIDTVDKDDFDLTSGGDTEISKAFPLFRNEKIVNKKHLDQIIEYYFEQTNDQEIYNMEFEKYFNFNSPSLDLNFANEEVLKFILYDAYESDLNIIKEHNEVYEELSDLPFDDNYKDELKKARFGNKITTLSEMITLDIDLRYKSQYKANVKFVYNTKTKTLSDYTIDDIILNKID